MDRGQATAPDPLLGLPPPPWIVGHRGVAGEAVENTVDSLRLAVEQRADMVEIDLQLSADGELVVFHDWDLERLAGRSPVVETMRLEELRQVELRAATVHGPRRGRIPTAGEALAALPPELPVNLELKRRSADTERFAAALAELLSRRPRVLVSSFDWELLAAVRLLQPELPVAPLAKRGRRALVAAGERLAAYSLHCHRRMARRRLARAARRAGRPLLVFTVNRRRLARRLLARGVDGLFTDFPGRLRAELEAR